MVIRCLQRENHCASFNFRGVAIYLPEPYKYYKATSVAAWLAMSGKPSNLTSQLSHKLRFRCCRCHRVHADLGRYRGWPSLLPLENAIHQYFIPALTGRPPRSSLERELLALPVRLGGLDLYNPAALSPTIFQASQRPSHSPPGGPDRCPRRKANCAPSPPSKTSRHQTVRDRLS